MSHPHGLTDPGERQQRRVLRTARLFVVAATLVMLALLGRIAQLQVAPDPKVERRAERRADTVTVPARRGTLRDTRGRPLALTRLGRRAFVDQKLIDDPVTFAAHAAHAINGDPARIDRLISERPESRYIVVEELLNEQQLQRVRRLDRRALATELRPVRHYPHDKLAAHVIGYVGDGHKGLDGVEYALERLLEGEPGTLRVLRDAARRPVWVQKAGAEPPKDGHDVRLSIDAAIQRIAAQELAEACRQHKADRGELVVMDARTGQLLAMANWPRFHPKKPTEVPYAQRRNRCVTDPYEPGSVFKPFLHAKATEAGLAGPQQKIDCTDAGFWVTEAGRRLHDAHGYGTITWNRVLVVSSNIGMAKVASQLGERRMHQAVRSYGFGKRTGTALPGESRGIVNPVAEWNHYSLTSVPMGQEIAVTPVQLARGFSAFANGGLVVSPSVLAAEADNPIYQRALPEDAADHTRKLLRRVVTDGTGTKAQSDLYRIWGKTGTAQVPDREQGGYKDNAYTASFICGAPLKDPRLIAVVTVHEPAPETGYYGGLVAAPVAKRVMERALPYLGVLPDAENAPRPQHGRIAHAEND